MQKRPDGRILFINLALRGYQEHHGAFSLFCQCRIACDLFHGWPPFIDMANIKTSSHQRIQGGAQGAVIFNHPVSQPVANALTFVLIVVNRPRALPLIIGKPSLT